jgi:16S rRNA (adenine1518-N6/adenine1519-N6)-dimethyltransferase
VPRKPKLGQNFLIDENAIQRIAASLGGTTTRTVVEIGPGHGAITNLLAGADQHGKNRCARLHCIEFDPALARELTFRFRNLPHVTIHHADILEFDLSTLLSEPWALDPGPSPLDVIGNLPYYITSDILLHLFTFARQTLPGGHPLLARAVLMMQREVADRIAAPPGVSDYGPLSAFTQLHATVSSLFTLPPSAFNPPPGVDSTVLRLDFAPRFAQLSLSSAQVEPFNRFLRSSFAQKRKTLANNLRNAGYTPTQLTSAWPSTIPPQARSEAIPLASMAHLFHNLHPSTPTSSPTL